MFKLTDCCKTLVSYIERWFTIIVENNNFVEIDYGFIRKLLSSSELNVDTEIEVFNAAEKWLGHRYEERSKFAKNILLKVRLHLLSDHCLKYIINEPSSFSKNEDCIATMKEILNNKDNFVKKASSLLLTHRYCNQQTSNILICGGRDTRTNELERKLMQVDGRNFKIVKTISSMKEPRSLANIVCMKGEVYFFGGCDKTYWRKIRTVEKYSLLDDCWSKVADMYDDRNDYCVCSFMDKIYLFGGDRVWSDSALEFDPNCTSKHKWQEVARMNHRRSYAACAVFEGKIVVSGGWGTGYNRWNNNLNTVESYDVIGNKWSPMANIINRGAIHNLVVVKNKLFVLGSTTYACEVYDSACRHFVALNSNLLIEFDRYYHHKNVIKVGCNIYVFSNNLSPTVPCYDVKRNKWTVKSFQAKRDLSGYSVVTIPSY